MYVNIGINIDFMLIHTEEWIDLPVNCNQVEF